MKRLFRFDRAGKAAFALGAVMYGLILFLLLKTEAPAALMLLAPCILLNMVTEMFSAPWQVAILLPLIAALQGLMYLFIFNLTRLPFQREM